MKKNLIILTLALLIALPLFGLAADAATPETAQLQAAQTAPLGGQYGRRRSQTPVTPDTTAPRGSFVDADDDGKCDICGLEQGKNTSAPGFIDNDKNGVCDNLGTDQQGQGRGQTGRGKGLQGNAQGGNYVDADNNGVCDNLGTATRQSFGGGRNRR